MPEGPEVVESVVLLTIRERWDFFLMIFDIVVAECESCVQRQRSTRSQIHVRAYVRYMVPGAESPEQPDNGRNNVQ